jgi:hypothetical protein
MNMNVPEFKSEAEEFEFWSTVDSTEYFDWSQAQKTKFVKLKPTLRTISVRLQEERDLGK